jgi:hypothetical protein
MRQKLGNFIKPAKLRAMCEEGGLRITELRSFVPRFDRAF